MGSGHKVFPGRGVRYVRIDARTFIFGSGKAEASFLMKRNQRKISWTMFYRRLHKKGLSEDVSKKSQKPEQRAAAREAALREIKAANKTKQDEKKKTASKSKAAPKAAPAAKGKGKR